MEKRYIPTKEEIEKLYSETEGLKRGKLDCKAALRSTNGNFSKAKEKIILRQEFNSQY